MDYTTLIFIFIFLPISLLVYYAIPNFRKVSLIIISVISIIFIGLNSVSSLIFVCISIVLNFIIGIILDKNVKNKKIILIIGIVLNVFILLFFKYESLIIKIPFFYRCKFLNLVMPIGISFYVFQNISYLVDIYKKKYNAEKNIINFIVYTAFFPRVLNGPICRYDTIKEQLQNYKKADIDMLFDGITGFAFGLGKVLIISSALQEIWNSIYEVYTTSGIEIITAWFGVICYAFYIFINFSGYIDISIGLGKMFGIILPENFNFPYAANSISNFWRRWHISLSNWFRDYIYIPLGGSRKGNVYLNLFIVFLLTGIWHGSSLNFIFWGIYNGIIIIMERIIRDKKFYKNIPNLIKHILTFILIIIGWVLFTCNGLKDSLKFYMYMFGIKSPEFIQYRLQYFFSIHNIIYILLAIIISFPILNLLKNRIKNNKIKIVFKGICAVTIYIISLVFLINSLYSPSLYAQF